MKKNVEIGGVCESDEELDEFSFLERAPKRRKAYNGNVSEKFIDIKFLLARSNVYERLFANGPKNGVDTRQL